MPRRINLGQGLVVIGALALLVSLFLDWYEVGAFGGDAVSAWTVFEIADLVLASLAVLAIAGAVPARLGAPEPRSLIDARWLPWVGVAALIFIVATLLNDPPAVRDRSPEIGVWVGLAGAALLTAGGLLSGSRISVVISTRPSEAPAATRPATATHPLEHEPTQPVDVDRSTEEWLPPEDERA